MLFVHCIFKLNLNIFCADLLLNSIWPCCMGNSEGHCLQVQYPLICRAVNALKEVECTPDRHALIQTSALLGWPRSLPLVLPLTSIPTPD